MLLQRSLKRGPMRAAGDHTRISAAKLRYPEMGYANGVLLLAQR